MVSATIVAIVYFLAYRNGPHFRVGWAWAVLMLALAATASTEHAREMLRKPYFVGQHMYSNGVRVNEVEAFKRQGYLTNSVWLRQSEKTALPKVAADVVAFPEAHSANIVRVGEQMFRGQCLACHTTNGYRAMTQLLKGRDNNSIQNLLNTLHTNAEDSPYRAFMPPLVGDEFERKALAKYLSLLTIATGSKETLTMQSQ